MYGYLTLIPTYYHQHRCPVDHQRKHLPLCMFPSSCDQHADGDGGGREEEQAWLNEQVLGRGEVAGWRWSGDNKGGTWLSVSATAAAAGAVWHSVKWSEDAGEILKSVAGHFKSGRWVYVFFMLLKTCDWSLAGCHSAPGDPAAECILHTTAVSHDVWPLCHGKLPSEGGGGGEMGGMRLCDCAGVRKKKKKRE